MDDQKKYNGYCDFNENNIKNDNLYYNDYGGYGEERKDCNVDCFYKQDDESAENRFSVDVTEDFWNKVRGNLEKVSDINTWQQICSQKLNPVIEDEELTSSAAAILPSEPWGENTYSEWVAELKKVSGKSGKNLFHPLRMALTAAPQGPELKTLLPLIGREKAYARLMGKAA